MDKNKEMAGMVQWYLETTDPHTYDLLLDMLGEDKVCKRECVDGKKRDLWDTDYESVCMVFQNKSYKELDFHVYKKVGNGPIRRAKVNFSKIRIKRLNYELKEILKRRNLKIKV